MRIWIKRGAMRKWIKDVHSFDIKTSMQLDGNVVPVSTRFVCKHTNGAFSVTPVSNLLETEWGIEPCQSVTPTAQTILEP